MLLRVAVPLALGLLAGCARPPTSASPGATVSHGVVYRTVGDVSLAADVHRPPGAGPFPAVLVVHGGGWVRGERADMEEIAEQLAGRGFVAVNASYRLAPGYHHPAQIDDLRAAVRWIRGHARELDVDAERIGGFGYSAGGHLVALLAVDGEDPSAAISVAVAGGAPYDLTAFPASPLVRKLIGEELPAARSAWESASPLTYVDAGDPPMFLYHGTWDAIVPFGQAERMRDALAREGVDVALHAVPLLGHVAVFLWSRGAVDRAIDFLEEELSREARADPRG